MLQEVEECMHKGAAAEEYTVADCWVTVEPGKGNNKELLSCLLQVENLQVVSLYQAPYSEQAKDQKYTEALH